MSKYFVTGDTHGFIDYKKLEVFASNHQELTKDDYVIVLGDVLGMARDEKYQAILDKYASLPFTVLFIDGNHENYDELLDYKKYPLRDWKGAKAQFLRPSLIHLLRGQIYDFDGHSVFTFGGALSQDACDRTYFLDYFPDEIPTREEYLFALDNLEAHGNKVDFILTHTADLDTVFNHFLMNGNDDVSRMLNAVEHTVKYGHWYFGHLHLDEEVNKKKSAVYNSVHRII